MEVTGKIKVINPEQQVSASFRKRELVVATEEQYPQFISINFVQDKCDLLNSYNVGEAVKVSINLRGRFRNWSTTITTSISGDMNEARSASAPPLRLVR